MLIISALNDSKGSWIFYSSTYLTWQLVVSNDLFVWVKILATSKLQQICRIHWNYIFPYWEICLDHPKFLWQRILLNESEVSELSWKTCFIYERRSESFINQGSNSRNAVLAYFFRFFKSENFVFWPSWYWNVLPADAVFLLFCSDYRQKVNLCQIVKSVQDEDWVVS